MLRTCASNAPESLQGRLIESHGYYTGSTEINRLEKELERDPEDRQEIQAHINDLKKINQGTQDPQLSETAKQIVVGEMQKPLLPEPERD